MKILHVSYSDIGGGAAKAAYRLHRALLAQSVESYMVVDEKLTDDPSVITGNRRLAPLRRLLRRGFAYFVKKLGLAGEGYRSPALLRSKWVRIINNSDVDIVNLHWTLGEMLSISDIRRIRKPLVWTLHDMWAFSGAEHYPLDDLWRNGYLDQAKQQIGFDLDRWVWRRKHRNWQSPAQLVCPSVWLSQCAKESALMSSWPNTIIPYAIDTDAWTPQPELMAREQLGLPAAGRLLAFGASGGAGDPRKGFDLLLKALEVLRAQNDDLVAGLEIVIFGQDRPIDEPNLSYPSHYLGSLNDESRLRALFSAVDLVVVPSRQDNLPNIAIEAQTCGTPVVAFDVGGLRDIVEHGVSGYLAKPLDPVDLAEGIRWIFAQELEEKSSLTTASRQSAEEKFSVSTVAEGYIKVYRSLLGD